MQTISTTVTKLTPLSPSVKLIRLFCGDTPFHFKPGQWISIQDKQSEQSAAYSISSIPNENNQIDIAVKHIPQIEISGFLHNRLKIGDAVNISPAQGSVVLPARLEKPVAFIAGGTGIAPFMSMTRKLLHSGFDKNITFLVSAASLQEFLFNEELKALSRKYARLDFRLTLTQSKDERADYHGRINEDMLKPLIERHQVFFLCGPPAMVDDVNKMLIACGVPMECIHFDKWW